MADEQRLTLTEQVGGNVRRWRAVAGVRQDDVVSAARRWGVAWTRSAVADLEAGRRRLTAEELVLLPVVLNDAAGGAASPTIAELVAGTEPLALNDRATLRPEQVVALLSADESVSGLEAPPAQTCDDLPDMILSAARHRDTTHMRQLELPLDDAEKQAGRRLGISARRVRATAVALWGHPLSAERDARAADLAADAPARSKQAVRGHVTRLLLGDLRHALDQNIGAVALARMSEEEA